MEYRVEEEISDVSMTRPHVVLLGAGGSRATIPHRDKNGRKAPLMNDFVEVVGLQEILQKVSYDYRDKNFEDIYNSLVEENVNAAILETIECKIYDYFSALELPPNPTIYDHLILSLRGKDLIATFNWDPLLIQAYLRNKAKFKLPKIVFLHGNVEIGICIKDKITGMKGTFCSKCKAKLTPTKLLYPIKQKSYHKDAFIMNEWKVLEEHLKRGFMFTIFGYSAPKSDISAIEVMKGAWGRCEERNLEQIEIIDIQNEDCLSKTWKDFIHTHHYWTKKSFYDSWIAKHPRRTVEACWNQFLEVEFINENPIPREYNFQDLWNWLTPLKEAEKS